jgi:ERF superfamily
MEPEETAEVVVTPPEGAEEAGALAPPLDAEALIAKAIEHDVSIDTLERLLALRERLRSERAREAFYTALAAFQGRCPIIPKTKTASIQSERGASYKYAYAPLDIIVRHVAPLLETFGLSVTTQTRLEEQPQLAQVAICTVHHVAGHSESSEFRAPIDQTARMNVMQRAASAQTYARRYAFCNALGILTGDEDDDAHALDANGEERDAFEPPRRKAPSSEPIPAQRDLADQLQRSVEATAAARRTVAADEEGPPRDALSKPRLARLYALLHDAVAEADVPEDQHDAVFDRARDWLRTWVATTFGRFQLAHCSYKDYPALCEQVPVAVEAALRGDARPQPRLVRRRTYSAPARRPLH